MQTTQPAAKDMLAKIFKAYDVRGIYPQPLDEGLAWRIGFAAAQYYAAVADRERCSDLFRDDSSPSPDV